METVQDMRSSRSNPVSCPETSIKIYGSKEEIRAQKSPETVDAPGFAPDASIPVTLYGASDEARTRYLHLGKVALYQMSYTRIWCLRPESNQRHADFQSAALPTELQRHMVIGKVATRKGLEPSTSGVTGRRSNQLNYRATSFTTKMVGTTGLEPVTPCL